MSDKKHRMRAIKLILKEVGGVAKLRDLINEKTPLGPVRYERVQQWQHIGIPAVYLPWMARRLGIKQKDLHPKMFP